MGARMTVNDLWLAVLAVTGGLVVVAGFIEKVWQPASKWAQRKIIEPATRRDAEMAAQLADVKDDVAEIKEAVSAMAKFVGYHLGANFSEPPLHDQVKAIAKRQDQDGELIADVQATVTSFKPVVEKVPALEAAMETIRKRQEVEIQEVEITARSTIDGPAEGGE